MRVSSTQNEENFWWFRSPSYRITVSLTNHLASNLLRIPWDYQRPGEKLWPRQLARLKRLKVFKEVTDLLVSVNTEIRTRIQFLRTTSDKTFVIENQIFFLSKWDFCSHFGSVVIETPMNREQKTKVLKWKWERWSESRCFSSRILCR